MTHRSSTQWLLSIRELAKKLNAESKLDGPRCGTEFAPEDGCHECHFCGRMLHAECTAYYGEAA